MNFTINRIKNSLTRSFHYIVKTAKYTSRAEEKSLVSDKGASVAVRHSDVSLSGGRHANYHLNGEHSTATEISVQSHTITNRKVIDADEIIINKHKLNPKLYEWTDMRHATGNNIIGRLQMEGTVLVKAWDNDLGRHVLIRRPCRQPLFGQTVNMADVPEQFGLDHLRNQ